MGVSRAYSRQRPKTDPWLLRPGLPARAGERKNTIQTVASPTTSPAVRLTMDPDINPTRPSQPSSLPHPQVIFIIFELYSISRIRTVYGTNNTIIGHELC